MKNVVQCPFYKREESCLLRCEGAVLFFHSRSEKIEFEDELCSDIDRWRKCPIAVSLNKYYERQGDK